MSKQQRNGWIRLLVLAALPALSACGDFLGTSRVNFTGSVIDGSTGARITNYDMSLVMGDIEIDVTVDSQGRFTTDEMRNNSAFFVTVFAAGYRPFESLESSSGGGSNPARTYAREIVLFPTSLTSPAFQLDVIHAAERRFDLSGTARFVPQNSGVSNVIDNGLGSDGVAQWQNDLDQQNEIITVEFTGGSVTLEAGRLVFGVQYRVDVFNVPGAAIETGAAFIRGGVDIGRVVDLSSLADVAPVLLTNSEDFCRPFPELSPLPGFTTIAAFEFNTPVEFEDEIEANDNLDFSVSATGGGAAREPDDHRVQISGTTVELQWAPDATFTSIPTSVSDVTFSSLGGIAIQRPGSPGSRRSLSSLVGRSSIGCSPEL